MQLTASTKPEAVKNTTNVNSNDFLTIVNVKNNYYLRKQILRYIKTFVFAQNLSPGDYSMCSPDAFCSELPVACIICTFNLSCIYGQEHTVNCEARKPVVCLVGNAFYLKKKSKNQNVFIIVHLASNHRAIGSSSDRSPVGIAIKPNRGSIPVRKKIIACRPAISIRN